MKKFDVIIVGAGVAGSYLGYLLTKKGLKVLLLEKNKKKQAYETYCVCS